MTKLSHIELAREADRILSEDDPTFCMEDVTRTDNVHVKIPLDYVEAAGVVLDKTLSDATTIHAGMVAFDDPVDSLDEKMTIERVLRPFAENTRHHVCQNTAILGARISAAMESGNVEAVESALVAAITADDVEYAIQVASARALIELDCLRDNAKPPFGAMWLVEHCGMNLRTAQRLLRDARSIEPETAALLIGTEYGARASLQRLMDDSKSSREGILSAVMDSVTAYRLTHSIAVEDRSRRRRLSRTELDTLELMGRSTKAIREHLDVMDQKAAVKLMAGWLDDHVKMLNLNERREKKMAQHIRQLKTALREKSKEAA